jgi:D-3-phosphoglycerate dehydrogenase / 2-oxoglutarate reductase
MMIIENKDQPGVIGTVGSSFGDAQVNIADMVIARDFKQDGTATALMMLKIDSAPPEALINRLRARPGILRVKSLALPARSA